MLDPSIGRRWPFGLCVGLACLLFPPTTWAQTTTVPRFAVATDRAAWEGRRPEVEKQLGGRLDQPARSGTRYAVQAVEPTPIEGHPEVAADTVRMTPLSTKESAVTGLFLRPGQPDGGGRAPLVVLLVDPCPAGKLATAPGWDGRPPALVLVEMGFSVLLSDDRHFHSLFGFDDSIPAALDVLLARPEVDTTRVAVIGLGKTGLTALRLMALDPRIRCGVVAIESQAAGISGYVGVGRLGGSIVGTNYQELAALCAPRPLCLMIGEPVPLPRAADSIGRRLEHAAKGTYDLYGKDGHLSFTLYGLFAGHESVSTRLQWLAGLEWLDKYFRPQGPTPLGHAAEPEPTFDPADRDVLNLTEHGIAGWSSEMSARAGTFTWKDGVVVCQPGEFEYGWLRAPIEVGDYLLQVEWRVPDHGNAGIFMRAQPVGWFLPPSEENKLRVSTLGLTWPSRTGLELQTQADAGEANRYSTGSLYRHAAPAANPTAPNRWNRSTVRARGLRIEVWNNGTQVLDTDLARAADTLPNPPRRGYIGLQNHGAPAEYRNVRLRPIPNEAKSVQRSSSGTTWVDSAPAAAAGGGLPISAVRVAGSS